MVRRPELTNSFLVHGSFSYLEPKVRHPEAKAVDYISLQSKVQETKRVFRLGYIAEREI